MALITFFGPNAVVIRGWSLFGSGAYSSKHGISRARQFFSYINFSIRQGDQYFQGAMFLLYAAITFNSRIVFHDEIIHVQTLPFYHPSKIISEPKSTQTSMGLAC